MSAAGNRLEEAALLNDFIPQFDEKNKTKLAKHILSTSKDLDDLIERFVHSPSTDKIQIEWAGDGACFRLRFGLPVLLLFHMSTRHNKQTHGYFRPAGKNFTALAAFIPAYNCNLNHLTLLKTHTFENTKYWPRLNKDEESEFICKKFINTHGEKMIQSSLNFMLQNNSKPENVSCDASNTVEKCFRYFYWRPPSLAVQYSPIHDMIYNSFTRVYSYHRIYKTIAKVAEIKERRDTFESKRYKINFSPGQIFMLAHDRHGVCTAKRGAVFAEPDRSDIQEGDLINCIIDSPVFPKPANPPRLIVSGLVKPPISPTDLRPIIGLAIWRITQRIDKRQKLCNIGSKEEVRRSVLAILKDNHIMFPSEWVTDFEKGFQSSLDEMFPLVFEDEGAIVHIPPPMMSYILSKPSCILDDKHEIANLAKLVDLAVAPDGRYVRPMKLRSSKIGLSVQAGPYKEHWNPLISDMPRIVTEIYYSRIFAHPMDPDCYEEM